MRLDVVYGTRGEWCVTVDGRYVVGFAGPDAHDRAERHREELEVLLSSGADAPPAQAEAAPPDSRNR